MALAQRDATKWFGESLLHDVIATLACRAAVKAGDLLEASRLQQLFIAARGVDFLSQLSARTARHKNFYTPTSR